MNSKPSAKILGIDFTDVEVNASQLFRFLAKFAVDFVHVHLIIFNIETQRVFDLEKISDCFFETRNDIYWNETKAMLIYSYIKIDELKPEQKFYFADVFWGKEKREFFFINDIISRTHFNSITKGRDFGYDDAHDYEQMKEKYNQLPQPFFDHNNNLHHFDLLLEDSSSNLLFNYNVGTLLQNHIAVSNTPKDRTAILKNELSGVQSLIDDVKNMQAYKIPDSHFRLGSRVHIKDFYYAKPFFQNSFFAYKFALLLAYDIIHSEEFKAIFKFDTNNKGYFDFDKERAISIIGYGFYSELLVCYVKDFLERSCNPGALIINTNTISDAEECRLNLPITEDNPIHKNVIIIVPIATTFSTSMKISNMLNKECAKRCSSDSLNILEPYYNVLSVVDESFVSGCIPNGSIFQKFGWHEVDAKNRIVKIKMFGKPSDVLIRQKYYISQRTKWYKTEDCEKCFPKCSNCDRKFDYRECTSCSAPANEEPLYVTDKASLTPELILGLPKARAIEEENIARKLVVSKAIVNSGHIERNSNHHRYYFNDNALWEANKGQIETWLRTIKDKFDNSAKSVILAPGHFSNAAFVEMVNNVVFSNRAVIIHYDTSIENAQNFNFYYGKTIGTDEAGEYKLYFADDEIASGNTLFSLNSILQRLNSENRYKQHEHELGLEACFFCVNRTSYYGDQDIERTLRGKKIYSFVDLHLPCSKSINTMCPLCAELEKKKKLYETSCLARVRRYFFKEQKQMEIRGIAQELEHENHRRVFREMECIHRVYDLFSFRETSSDNLVKSFNKPFREWADDLFRITDAPFIVKVDNDQKLLTSDDDTLTKGTPSEMLIYVLECLTQSPFINYKIIRENVFRWTLNLLEEKIVEIENDIDNKKSHLCKTTLDDLKVLIRIATVLNSNYIFSYKFLHHIRKLYSHAEDSIGTNAPLGSVIYPGELLDFSVFIAAQINELLYEDEGRCYELNRRLMYFESLTDNSKFFQQLVRMLLLENAVNLRAFASYISEMPESDRAKFYSHFFDDHYKYYFEHFNLLGYNKNKILSFVKSKLEFNETLVEDSEAKNTYTVRAAFDGKIRTLLELVDVDMSQGGCFVIVRYNTSDSPYFLLFNEGKEKSFIERHEDDWLDESGFMMNFLTNGLHLPDEDNNVTVTEFLKSNGGEWRNSSFVIEQTKVFDSFPLPISIRRLLLLRIANDDLDTTNGQAVIGFYFSSGTDTPTSIENLQYLLLLRADLSRYFEKTVEENDSFRELVEAKEKTRYMFNLRHGIEVYENVVSYYIRHGTMSDVEKAVSYLTNKIHLMSALAPLNIIQRKALLHPDLIEVLCLSDLIEEFYSNSDFVFTMKHKEITGLNNMDRLEWINKIDKHYLDEILDFPITVKKEIVFELLYNIRKYAVHDYNYSVCNNEKLKVEFQIKSVNNYLYLSISNNHYHETIPDIDKFNKQLNSKNTHGLGLINTIFSGTIGVSVFVEVSKDKCNFIVNIPIKRTDNTLTESKDT